MRQYDDAASSRRPPARGRAIMAVCRPWLTPGGDAARVNSLVLLANSAGAAVVGELYESTYAAGERYHGHPEVVRIAARASASDVPTWRRDCGLRGPIRQSAGHRPLPLESPSSATAPDLAS